MIVDGQEGLGAGEVGGETIDYYLSINVSLIIKRVISIYAIMFQKRLSQW